MNILLKAIAILFTTIYLFCTIKKIKKGKVNLLDYCYIAFYLVQVLPIFVEMMFGIDSKLSKYGLIYQAMLDERTELYYLIFLILSTFLFTIFSKKTKKNIEGDIKNKILSNKLLYNKYIKLIVFITMFITIPAIFFAPNIRVYTEYLYLYRHNISENSPILVFHYNIMKNLNLIAFCSILYYYLVNQKKENIFWIAIATILMTWINQKRTMLLFIFIGILIIDILFKNKNIRQVLRKAIFFIIIEAIYFYIYILFSKKGIELSFMENYTLYFSRMANTKLAIYDILNGGEMLNFWGETILYQVLFFIPRSMWPDKPYPYYVYHTAYSYNANKAYLGWGFQTNIWCEFISNFGIFMGIFSAFIFILIIVKISSKSDNIWTYLFRRNILNA